MNFNTIDLFLSQKLPGEFLKDLYTRGMRRFAEYGLFTQEFVVNTKYGFSMKVNRLDAIKWYIHYFGHFEPQISKAWQSLLRPGDTVVDIGTNVGYHALLAAVCVGKTGKVLAFEPSTPIHTQLLDNIKLNSISQIDAQKLAVSDKRGYVDLYFGGANSQGNSSILASHGGQKTESVATITFDEIAEMVPLKSIKLIKIDVEGAEGLVLTGLLPHIEELNPKCVIFLEISPENALIGDAMIAPFIQKGFHVMQIANEYTTAFYRQEVKVQLNELNLQNNKISDLILCRDIEQFKIMSK
jgi:FkbM family methyltransferase